MKTQIKHRSRIKHRLRQVGLVGLVMAALVAVDGGQMGKARADVRVNARLKLPHVTVHFQHGPKHGRVHRPFVYRVTQRDRMIARRLAHQSGYRRNILLDLRARGLSWKQVGRRLDIPRRTIKMVVRSVDHADRDRHRGPRSCGNRWR
jgi:DNA-binding NarL/FixJ family response regulator